MREDDYVQPVTIEDMPSDLSSRAFTMMELLVVIAVLGVLTSLLAAGLSSAVEKAKEVRCIGNLRQIGIAVAMYAGENGDQIHHVAGAIPDQGQWTANPWTNEILPANHPAAYWGVAYAPYLDGAQELFRCPSARRVDEWREEGLPYPPEFWLHSTYGINRHIITPFGSGTPGPLKITSLQSPGTTLLAQDAAEQRMEGEDDSLGLFPGVPEILRQWRFALQPLYPEREMWLEWYRHRRRCTTLWLAGHVTSIPFRGFTEGLDYRSYTGELPLSRQHL